MLFVLEKKNQLSLQNLIAGAKPSCQQLSNSLSSPTKIKNFCQIELKKWNHFLRVVLSFAQTLNPKFIILVGKKSTTWLAKATTLTGRPSLSDSMRLSFLKHKLSDSATQNWVISVESSSGVCVIQTREYCLLSYSFLQLGSKPRFDSVISVGTDWQTSRVKC